MSALTPSAAQARGLREGDHIPCDGPPSLAVAAIAIEAPHTHRVVLVAKLTLQITPADAGDAVLELAEEPHPLGGDVFAGEPFASSLRSASDFAPAKPRADVTLSGIVRRPGGAKRAEIAFSFGGARGFRRRAVVFGIRRFDALGRVGQPEPFTEVPLVYERACGGPGSAANPVGLGQGDLAPHIEDPDAPTKRRGDARAPVCFGPIAPTWPVRWSRLGTFDPAWTATGWPSEPHDHDPTFHQHAPESQQVSSVRGDEPFRIEGIASEGARIVGALPGLDVEAVATRMDGGTERVAMRIDAVAFDTETMTVDLVFRGNMTSKDRRGRDVRAVRFAILGREGVVAAPEENSEPFADESSRRPASVEAPGPTRAEVEALLESGGSLVGASLHGAQLRGIDLSGADLTGADLSGADLREARLAGACLDRVDLGDADLTSADLSATHGAHARLEGATLRGANLSRAALPSVVLTRADLEDARLERCELVEGRLYDARASRADLRSARLDGLRAEGASFDGATLDEAVITGGVLDGATFTDAKLRGTRFDDAGLRGVVFDGADLSRATLARARLSGASLRSARAPKANLMEAELDGAIFCDADLRGANLYGADVRKADWTGVRLEQARLAATLLARAR